MANIGFRVVANGNRPSPQLVEQFQNVVTPHVSDNLNRMEAVSAHLRPYHKRGRLLGVALTVKTRPGDNLMVHKAIDVAQPGDVIVVDAGGDLTNAIVGEIMLRLALKKGITGFVIDGAIRDTAAFAEGEFPVYARGVTHRGPYKDGPGEVNVPVSIGGMIVHPGDIMIGDEDGVVAVSPADAEALLKVIREQQIRENSIMDAIEDGTIDRTWVDDTLKQKGCEMD
jgi:RraA family protein